VLGNGADHLDGAAAGCLLRRTGLEALAGHLAPAHAEVRRDVCDRWPFEAWGHVMPPELGPRDVVVAVEPLTAFKAEIDAADVRDTVVDLNRLLVMAVQRPLVCVERVPRARSTAELVHAPPDGGPRRPEER
jgi:hypothetical protein